MSAQQMRVIGLTGLIGMVALFVGFALDPNPPTAGTTGAAVLAQGASSGGLDRATAFLFGITAAGLVAFVAGVRQWFETISTAPRWWGTTLLAGGVVTGTTLVVGGALSFTLSSEPAPSSDIARFVNDAVNYTFVFAGFGVLVMVTSLTALALATGGPLKRLGQLGVLVSLLQIPYLATAFFSSGPFTAGGLVTIIGFVAAGILMLVTAVYILVSSRKMLAASRG
jgi:hypothetical protein